MFSHVFSMFLADFFSVLKSWMAAWQVREAIEAQEKLEAEKAEQEPTEPKKKKRKKKVRRFSKAICCK